MKVEEAIKLINDPEKKLYHIDAAESLINYEKELAHNIDISRYGLYEISTSYFQLEDGILGIKGLSNIYSEKMNESDCDVQCYAFEAEEYTTINYRPLV